MKKNHEKTSPRTEILYLQMIFKKIGDSLTLYLHRHNEHALNDANAACQTCQTDSRYMLNQRRLLHRLHDRLADKAFTLAERAHKARQAAARHERRNRK